MSHKRIPKASGNKLSLKQMENKIYIVKMAYSATGRINLGIAALGKKVMVELITPPTEEFDISPQFTMEEALKKEYNVINNNNSCSIQFPLILLGARIKIHFVN